VLYELPFGHGRHFDLHGPADEIAGGWRIASIFQWHSGLPFTVVENTQAAQAIDPGLDSAYNNGTTLFPNLIGDPNVSGQSLNEWFNTASYQDPANGTFGNSGRNSLTGPHYSDFDFGVAKMFSLHWEGVNLEIRGDMFNAFNHINYANPNAAFGAA